MQSIEYQEFPYVRGMQKSIVMLVISTTSKARGDIFLLIQWKSWLSLNFVTFMEFIECHGIYGIPAVSMEIIETHEFRYVRGTQKCIVMLVISTTFEVRGDIFL